MKWLLYNGFELYKGYVCRGNIKITGGSIISKGTSNTNTTINIWWLCITSSGMVCDSISGIVCDSSSGMVCDSSSGGYDSSSGMVCVLGCTCLIMVI